MIKYLTHAATRTFLILVIWFFCIYQLFIEFEKDIFLDFTMEFLIFMAIIISLFSFRIDLLRFQNHRKPMFLLPTLITVICIAITVFINKDLKKQDSYPILYHAFLRRGNISVDFRQNGTYRCEKSYGFFTNSYYIRGKYFIKDSMIYLDRANFFGVINADKLLMKSFPKSQTSKKKGLLSILFKPEPCDSLPDIYLFQVDKGGSIRPTAVVLEINPCFIDVRDL